MCLKYVDGILHQKWTRPSWGGEGYYNPPEEEWRPVPGLDLTKRAEPGK